MQGFIAAIRWLTILPTPASSAEDGSRALIWLPAVGCIVGCVVLTAAWLGSWVDNWLAALLGMVLWLSITGFLHADGLADLADALGASHRDRTRFVAVLKDPHIGSFGVMSLLLLVVSKLVLLKLLLDFQLWQALLLIPAWARLGAVWWAVSLPALTEGSAKSWGEGVTNRSITRIFVLLLVLTLLLLQSFWLLLAAPLVIWLWRQFLKKVVTGMNGDCLGAGIELCEVMMLVVLVAGQAR